MENKPLQSMTEVELHERLEWLKEMQRQLYAELRRRRVDND